MSTTNCNALQTKNVTTTVNKIRYDLFSCLFLEVLNSSQLYQNSLDETDLTYVFNYLLRVLTQHVSLVHYSDWFLHHFVWILTSATIFYHSWCSMQQRVCMYQLVTAMSAKIDYKFYLDKEMLSCKYHCQIHHICTLYEKILVGYW